MPVNATSYASDFQVPELLQRDRGSVLTCPVYRGGALVTPTVGGSSCTLYRPDGSKLLDATTITESGGIAQVSVDIADLAAEPFGMGWRVEWTLVLGGQTHTFVNDAGVVYNAPNPVAHQGDMTKRQSSLLNWLTGTGETTLDKWVDSAWEQLQRWLMKQGNRAALIVSTSDLKDLHTLWALKLFFEDLVGAPNPREEFLRLYERYCGELEAEQNSAAFREYDADGDGAPDGPRPARAVTILGNGGGQTPNPRWVGGGW